MSKQCEIDYFRTLGPAGQQHAMGKPFSDANCANYLMQFGAVMRLLPPAPARILDCGCGTGWTSRFLARRGYDVTGVDISADKLQVAESLCRKEGLDRVRFVADDYEQLPFEAEFDAALFYDSLHHALDEESALRSAYRALVPGGVCIASEPGVGHARGARAQATVAHFGVTERDMPPVRVIAAGRRIGFRSFTVFPHMFGLAHALYGSHGTLPGRAIGGRLRKFWRLIRLATMTHTNGIVYMTK